MKLTKALKRIKKECEKNYNCSACVFGKTNKIDYCMLDGFSVLTQKCKKAIEKQKEEQPNESNKISEK